MRMLGTSLLVLSLVLAPPALGQDILRQFGRAIEELVPPERAAPRPRRTTEPLRPAAEVPAEEEAEDAEEAPLPRPRPEAFNEEPAEPEEDVALSPDAETQPDAEEAAPQPLADQEEDVPPPLDGQEEAPSPLVDEALPEESGESAAPEAPAPEEASEETQAEAVDERIYQAACPAVIMGLVEAEMTPPISEGQCGQRSPLTVTGVLVRGRMLPLSSPITTDCQMASALPGWLDSVDGYAEAFMQSPLAEVVTGTSYFCRARVGGDSHFTSEHGFANALDVVGFTLEDGRQVNVEGDWSPADAPQGRLLRLAHDSACGSFMTVLGPEANAEHEDHLHLDQGCHGAQCTTRICE